MSKPYTHPNLRLEHFDYTFPGPYFVTICLHVRIPRFGTIHHGLLELNDAGKMVEATWQALPAKFPSIMLDAFVAMPDHIHGLLTLHDGAGTDATPHLSTVMQVFKSITNTRYIAGVKAGIWPRFEKHLWQPNYQDHIIRGERDFETKRRYIEGNPARWSEKHER